MGKLSSLLSFVNSIVPKRNIIIFNSFPDVSGNALALYEYMLRNRGDMVSKYKLVWSVANLSEEEAKKNLQQRTGVVQHDCVAKKSFRGMMLYFSAKYIVSTHGYFPGIQTAKKQTHINLWHGMPFKRIGRLLEEVHTNGKSDEADVTIATSEVFQDLMAKAFGIEKSRVPITGQPCNDDLLKKSAALKKLGLHREQYKKVIAWLPTYRNSVVGDIRTDGKVDSFGVQEMLSEHFEELDSCLREKGYLLVIKPHPMDVICQVQLPQSNHIQVITNHQLSARCMQLYELLSDCDVLLTDYSSVFIDFLITDKPMAFVCDDLKEYGGTRGFCFENPRVYMPGELISDYKEFLAYLADMDAKNETWKARYGEVKAYFNPLCDAKASQRVCDAFWPKA